MGPLRQHFSFLAKNKENECLVSFSDFFNFFYFVKIYDKVVILCVTGEDAFNSIICFWKENQIERLVKEHHQDHLGKEMKTDYFFKGI